MTTTLAAPGRTVTRNVAALLGARGVSALAGLVSVPIVFSRLGPSRFGVWAVLSGMATVVALADLGLSAAIVRQVASTAGDAERTEADLHRTQVALAIGLAWGIALAAIGAVVIAIAWPSLASLLHFGAATSSARWAALVLMVGVLVDGIALPWRGVLEGSQHYDALSRINAATAVLGGALAVLAVTTGGRLVELAVAMAATAAVRAVLVITSARRQVDGMVPRIAGMTTEDIRAVSGYGLRVQVTTVSGAVNLELDRFFLTGFFTPAAAGGFELGARVVNLFRLIPVFALVALFPMAVTRTAELGPGWLDAFDISVSKYLTAVAAIGAAVMVACADPLIRMWLGEPNRHAVACIVILAPAYAVNLAAGSTGILSRVEGRPGRETRYAIMTMVINLALTWPLLELLGPKGIPLATAIGTAVGTVHFVVTYHRVTDRPLGPVLAAIWPSIAAALVAGAAGLLVRVLLPDAASRVGAGLVTALCAAVVVLLAGGILFLTGFLGRDDLDRLRRLHRGTALPPAGAAGA